MVEFKRKIYDDLLRWKNEGNGSTSIVIEGARRVGKTTIAKEFAKNEYKSYILIDFSIEDRAVREAFEKYAYDLDEFFTQLKFITKKTLYERNSVIIFDEIQLYPKARQMIKRLVADHRYDYIETGSLISIKENVKGILVPSEEESTKMHPMDFEEFLWAMGDEVSMDYIRQHFNESRPLGREMHERIMRTFRTYMIVGGMPQVVDRYVKDRDFKSIDGVKRNIINLYRNDILKLPESVSSRALRFFESIPSLLSSKKKIVMPSKIQKGTRMRDYKRSITWLSEAMIINPCRSRTDPSPTPGLDIVDSRVKPYLLDTGLLISLAFNNADKELMNKVYDSLLRGKLSINEGMFFENIVAQELTARGYELTFTEFKTEESSNLYEVDFILPRLNKISPVEVKSSASSRHASLDILCAEHHKIIEHPRVVHSKDLRADGELEYIPVYMTMLL